MEILKAGAHCPKEFKVEATCEGGSFNRDNYIGGCGALLMVSASDMFLEQSGNGVQSEIIVCYVCPACSRLNHVPQKDWPPAPEALRSSSAERRRQANNRIDPY